MNSQKGPLKKKKEKPPKPKYNMLQNSAYMIALAWREKEKKVLVLSLLTALLAVAGNMTNLYITPSALKAIEIQAPLGRLVMTILGFAGLSMLIDAASAYVEENSPYGRMTLRTILNAKVTHKMASTSYPNIHDDTFLKMIIKCDGTLSTNDSAGEAVWNTLTKLLQNTLGFAIYLALLSTVNPILFAAIIAITLAGYFIRRPINAYRYRHREEEAEYSKICQEIIRDAESTQLAKDIRLFGMRSWLEEIWDKTMDAFAAFNTRVEKVYIWGRITDLVLTFLRNGIIYAYLIYLVLNGELSISLFLLYFSAAGQFSSWVIQILDNLLKLHSQSLEISNLRECLEYPEPFRLEEGKPLSFQADQTYEIRLEDVSFRYPEAKKDTLSHINLTLHPGEKLAVVGLNGAGKTTLIKLLCGFLDPTEGRVLWEGRDIREYNRRDYYKMFSAVFQDFSLLAVSVAANVAQTEEHIDMARVRDCISKAGLQEKIESLPQQYDTKLNREVHESAAMLSGGETQRLMLARALYKAAPFVVLDEPTAALDPIAEADLYNKYNDMTQGCSSVYISHRLASTRFCDRIILIEDGHITEEGTHDSLLAHGGSSAKLFQVQSKYYQEGEVNDVQE